MEERLYTIVSVMAGFKMQGIFKWRDLESQGPL